MKKFHINVVLTAGVIAILLLNGCVSGIVSISQSTTTNASQQKDTVTSDDAVITCYVGGIPHSQTISYESGTYLKELFSALAYANAYDPCSAETQQLQQQILLYAEQQGLLPAGMSANKIVAQLGKRSQNVATRHIGDDPSLYNESTSQEFFCNFVSTGEGAAFPIIILPRFIPIVMAPIPRLFVGWKTASGITSVGGLVSGTGFIASGQQRGIALGFWGIGFSIFLPPVNAYGMFGYALYAKVSAEDMEYYPPNNPPDIAALYPLNGAAYVPLSTSELRFNISDLDGDLMSYSVTTFPDVGGGNGNMKPDGTYTVPVSDLKSFTEYIWHVTVSDGKDTVEAEFTFTTEAVAPIISDLTPMDGDRYVPVTQGYLRFHLRDPQNDLMSYTVETSPFIGSGSGSGVGEGDISVPISGLEVITEYRWFVNVTDGENPTSEVFWFRTEPPMVFDPFAEGWGYRKMITVNHTMVAGDLDYFPVLLDLTDTDLRDKAQDDGDDILFMDGSGVATRLYHELEEFDGSTGRMIAWVNVSSLNPTVDTSFYMYYGNMDSYDQQCPEKTWDAGFVLVQHFNERSGTLFDSTGYSNDGIPHGGVTQDAVGKIGNADSFDGDNDYVECENSPSLNPSSSLSLEAWYKPVSFYGRGNDPIIDKGYGQHQKPYYQYHLGVVGDSYPNQHAKFAFYITNPSDLDVRTGDGFWVPNVWYHLVGTYDGSTERLYVNGVLIDSRDVVSTMADFGKNLRIGRYTDLNACLPGTIDEVRISSVARSAAWVITEYHNQEYPLGFFDVGLEEPHP